MGVHLALADRLTAAVSPPQPLALKENQSPTADSYGWRPGGLAPDGAPIRPIPNFEASLDLIRSLAWSARRKARVSPPLA